jgi:hypothetical protein
MFCITYCEHLYKTGPFRTYMYMYRTTCKGTGWVTTTIARFAFKRDTRWSCGLYIVTVCLWKTEGDFELAFDCVNLVCRRLSFVH